jgi:hypothetical protein
MDHMDSKKKILVYNTLFLIFCGGIFLFLWYAPPETTAHLPHDPDHERFMTMGKKEAEKFCTECHSEQGVSPLPESHPPKYRCLFCHKRK